FMTALPLLIVVLILAAGTGAAILRWMRLELASTWDYLVLGIPLGLGVVAHLVLLLGLIGWLTAGAVSTGLILLAIVSIPGFKSLFGTRKSIVQPGETQTPSFRTALREESGKPLRLNDEGFL